MSCCVRAIFQYAFSISTFSCRALGLHFGASRRDEALGSRRYDVLTIFWSERFHGWALPPQMGTSQMDMAEHAASGDDG
jgi:hypothetical protein